MTRAQRARARHAAARDLRARAAGAAVHTDRHELVSLLGSVDDREVRGLAAATLRAHGLTADPALRRAEPGTPVALRLSRASALRGVALVGIAATAFGTARLWIYGVLFAIAALLAAALIVARGDVADRVVPDAVPRGHWVGVACAAALTVVIAVFVAVPIYASRRGWL